MPYKQSIEYHRKWRRNNPEKTYYNPEWHKNYWLQKHYGISIGQYNELFNKQKGRCAICKKHQTEMKAKLGLDHNHKTGKNRELLCFPCNTRLSILENTNWFELAETYLRRHSNAIPE